MTEASENDTSGDKDIETSAPLSWITSSSGEEDSGSRPTAYASLSLDQFEFDFPRRTFVPHGDSYSILMNSPPRKQVPLGPDHQASLPPWSGCMNDKAADTTNSVGPNYSCDIGTEEMMMGTCIISMPDSNLCLRNSANAGQDMIYCECSDDGSIRCVRQHVKEAREKLLKSLGQEKFVKLGFLEMGEEVSGKWSEEEEQIFHKVVFSNPVSLGRNFWKVLSAVFPYRTKKEIVSYYFNVFMLRRRAVQNRSYMLDIDSDDDEWHGSVRRPSEVVMQEEEEDSGVDEPLVDQENQANGGEESSDDDDDHDSDDSDGDVGDCSENANKETSEIAQAYIAAGNTKPVDDDKLTSAGSGLDRTSQKVEDGLDVQDSSCTSFEFQTEMVNSCSPARAGCNNLQESGVKIDVSKSSQGRTDSCNDLVGHVYLMDSCDAKVWDAARYLSPIKGVDLLPTCNIIDEIFGQGTWETKTTSD